MNEIERRRYPRINLSHVTVEVYTSLGELLEPELCFVINVSENGMLFKSESKNINYNAGMLLRLTFGLPESNLIIRTDATVIHTRATELSQYVGVQFKNLGLAETKFLRDYVEKKLKEETK
jgi:hypothetical protein